MRLNCLNYLKWGDIVLDSKRSGSDSLCISSGENHGCENEGMWTCDGMKDCELNWTLGSVCITEFA